MINFEKKIKICGLTRKEDVLAVNCYKPDYAGFVFAPGKRQLNFRQAELLRNELLPAIPAVGVFVNSPADEIISLVKSNVIQMIQLHGEESEADIWELKNRLDQPVPIIKAIRVKSSAEISEAEKLSADYLLLDSYVKGMKGGSGTSFDWSMIPMINKPWFLAGGIGMENIEEALKTKAFCLDVSSLAETNGRKDPEKIKKIIQTVRSGKLCQKEDLDSTADNLSPKR
ncbi:phosphoribosylanthranilate isomerase [Clostridium boliviensis]|uniref:N-(5'-phosphoribosyl)anthranilate isomerase n=1 Tax=Clostridium boliviensis TaxID=318465 RepID=A0ABU4GPN9_9CLOT|nr:phosphoribosylanthranilate isomerase [Clostridium boliviensis]MDW2798192.1 phosphoribosylanthranilate isomerase [Clostridium boliviensis]